MKAISRRIGKLQERLAPGDPPQLMFFCSSLYEGFIDTSSCRKVLDEYGFLPTTPGMHIGNLWACRTI